MTRLLANALLAIEDDLNECLRRVDGLYLAAGGLSHSGDANALQRLVLDLDETLGTVRDALSEARQNPPVEEGSETEEAAN